MPYPWDRQTPQGSGYDQLKGLYGGGGAADSMRRGSDVASWYRDQMSSKDPLGTLANLENYASRTYGQQAGGIRSANNAAMSQYQQQAGGGGIGAAGANPRMGAFAGLTNQQQLQGQLGNAWGQAQMAETGMKQQARTDLGAYRQGMAGGLADWEKSLAQAQSQDDQLGLAAGTAASGREQAEAGYSSQLLNTLISNLMQRGSLQGGGFTNSQTQQFLASLFGGQGGQGGGQWGKYSPFGQASGATWFQPGVGYSDKYGNATTGQHGYA